MNKNTNLLLQEKINEAKHKAINNLARYKFMNFGYWCAIFIYLNKLQDKPTPNPFTAFVKLARRMLINTHPDPEKPMNSLAIYEVTEEDIQNAAQQMLHRQLTPAEITKIEGNITKGMEMNENTIFSTAFEQLA